MPHIFFLIRKADNILPSGWYKGGFSYLTFNISPGLTLLLPPYVIFLTWGVHIKSLLYFLHSCQFSYVFIQFPLLCFVKCAKNLYFFLLIIFPISYIINLQGHTHTYSLTDWPIQRVLRHLLVWNLVFIWIILVVAKLIFTEVLNKVF